MSWREREEERKKKIKNIRKTMKASTLSLENETLGLQAYQRLSSPFFACKEVGCVAGIIT